jgi:hypothetical protein
VGSFLKDFPAIIIIIIIIIQFFIYLRAEVNSQWPITESAQIQRTAIKYGIKRIKTRKTGQLRLFTLRYELLKICVHLQTAFAAVAGGATERGKITYVSSRNMNFDCFEDRI